MKYDLLLRKGHVIDPSQGINAILDVGIKGEKIEDLGSELDAGRSLKVLDLKGKFVCPGLVDLHGHWYEGSIYGIDPHISLNHGVTTVVDAGTSGFINFPYFRKHTIDHAQIRIFAFLHIRGDRAAGSIQNRTRRRRIQRRHARVKSALQCTTPAPSSTGAGTEVPTDSNAALNTPAAEVHA